MSSEIPPTEPEGDSPDQPATPSDRDPMGPPPEPCECSCLHCGRVFMSNQMWFQRVIGDPSGFEGFWMCPTPNCGGAGFAFDIFPVDPDHPANEGWHSFDDDDNDNEPDGPWDPTESKYQEMDEDEDDDLEGEEWKLGLSPGERPEPEWLAEARRQEAERQKQFDGPDLRPREVHWTPREDPGTEFNTDDIPF